MNTNIKFVGYFKVHISILMQIMIREIHIILYLLQSLLTIIILFFLYNIL